MVFSKEVFCLFALGISILILSSCQTVQGVGRDVANLGKAVVSGKKNGAPAVVAPAASPKPVTLPASAPAASAVAPTPAAKTDSKKELAPQKKDILRGMWEGLTKPLAHLSMPSLPWGGSQPAKEDGAHPKISLSDLEPGLVKKESIHKTEAQDSMVLEDLPAKSDIQEIPTPPADYWKGATAVDVNGDGIPDVRYRQRN